MTEDSQSSAAEYRRNIERRPKVEGLKAKLREFATLDTQAREKALKELSDLVGNTVTDRYAAEMLVTYLATQTKVREASKLAFETPFEINGKEQNVWNRGYSIAVLSEGGEVLGLLYEPTPSLSEYGYLGIFALRKALFELHLDKAGKEGGLSSVENIEYIAGLGLVPGEDLFRGSTAGPIDFGYGPAYIGGSGCEATRDYLKGVLNITENPEVSIRDQANLSETQAGLFDRMFCGMTSMYLLGKEPTAIQEPPLIRDRRYDN